MVNESTLGSRLREARKEAHLSLATVANEANMSISTLSRIETGKQALEIETLISLSKILGVDPGAVIRSTIDDEDPVDSLLQGLQVLAIEERIRLWRQLNQIRDASLSSGRARVDQLGAAVEELLAQVDLLRNEIERVKGQLPHDSVATRRGRAGTGRSHGTGSEKSEPTRNQR